MNKQVKRLWSICFNDSPEFIELYFRSRYSDERNVAICRDGKVLAALQLLPYPMSFCHTEIPTAYISGACTHPDFRGQGIMKKLLVDALQKMYEQDFLLSTLIPAEPWLFGYYAQIGYATLFHQRTVSVNNLYRSYPGELHREKEKGAEGLYTYFHAHMQSRPCCIQHTREDFLVILGDLQVSEGEIYTLRHNQTIQALAILYPQANGWLVSELLADQPETEEALLQKICQDKQLERINLLTPATADEGTPLGMGRIIHPLPLLQYYAATHPQACLCYHLTDEQLPANNGYYHIGDGVCTHSTTPRSSTHNYQLVSIGKLAEQLLLPMHPYMSLMLD